MKSDLIIKCISIMFLLSVLMPFALAQGDPNTGVEVYKANCASCHGASMEGSIGPALKDTSFVSGSDEAALVQIVAEGRAVNGMPAFKDQLSEQAILDVSALMKNPDVLLSQNAISLDISRPDVRTDDIFPSLIKSFLFIFLWTGIAMVALLAWINHSRHGH
jgi:cytochrome c553